jgi:hypothetical protein
VDQVHALFVTQGLADAEEVQDINGCLKQGVLLGHIDLHNKGKDDALYEGKCSSCAASLVCTFRDALFQHTHGGDYEDGGENGAVECKECENRNYITALCTKEPHFDCGKHHNHCTKVIVHVDITINVSDCISSRLIII